jgi:hypothetical protein
MLWVKTKITQYVVFVKGFSSNFGKKFAGILRGAQPLFRKKLPPLQEWRGGYRE